MQAQPTLNAPPRHLHRLEKIVAFIALFAVLALMVGFAEGAGPKKKAKAVAHAVDEYDRAQAAQPEKVFLRSSSVLVQDASNGETILAKNSDAVLPIASITKLMTAMVALDARLPLDERLTVEAADVAIAKGKVARLKVGVSLTRREMFKLALMSSENRAAAALPARPSAYVAANGQRGAEQMCGLSAYQVDFTKEELKQIYGSKKAFQNAFEKRLGELEKAGWSLPVYRDMILGDARKVEF